MRRLALVALIAYPFFVYALEAKTGAPLEIAEVIAGVERQYPPYLAAMIEQDIANGRLRSAEGGNDTVLKVGATAHPSGYYDGETGYAMLEQPLPFWGGAVYGGYRLATGYLADYNKKRTPEDGQAVLGFRIPLLRDGAIDERRAKIVRAKIDAQLADPFILRQRLDFIRSATVAYYAWVAAGLRQRYAEELLRVATERRDLIEEQIKHGASPPLVRTDNERLVVSREIALIRAKRRLSSAAIELSLFFREADGAPLVVGAERLPEKFPEHRAPTADECEADLPKALSSRPEIRRYELTLEKARVNEGLAKNSRLPNLDVGLEVQQSVNGGRLRDIESSELEGVVELKIPLERRDAEGRLKAARAGISRIELEARFARDKISADVRDSHLALAAAAEQIDRAERNIALADRLREAEVEKFKHGAADLLALQLREQAAYEARDGAAEARAEYFRALANYRAATAADAPAEFDRGKYPEAWGNPADREKRLESK